LNRWSHNFWSKRLMKQLTDYCVNLFDEGKKCFETRSRDK
jgi:hypothetical protein